MRKYRTLISVGLVAILGVVAALAIMVGHAGSSGAVASRAGGDADLTVPSSSMPLSANWKAQPASGSAVQLAWPNVKVNPDSSSEAQNEPFVAVDPSNPNHIVV